MRSVLVFTVALASAFVTFAPPREAEAGIVIHDSVFRTEDLRLEQAYLGGASRLSPGSYVIEFAPKAATSKGGIVVHDLVGRLFLREGGALVRKGEMSARLEVDESVVKLQGARFSDLGFKDGHRIAKAEKPAALEGRLQGIAGASITFSLARATQ